jgi:HK97 family phage major capsid protein
MAALATDNLINIGEQVKAVKVSPDGRYLEVGAYGLRFANPEEKDLTGEFFTKSTDYGPHGGNGVSAMFHHCQPVGDEPEVKALAERIFQPVTAIKDSVGIFVKHVLDMADEYQKAVGELVQAGKLVWSSGTASHVVAKKKDAFGKPTGEIKRWHILEWSYTPQPAEPRLPAISPLKAVKLDTSGIFQSLVNVPKQEAGKERPIKSGAGSASVKADSKQEMNVMNLIEKLKALIPGMTDEQYNALAAALELYFATPPSGEAPQLETETESEAATAAASDAAVADAANADEKDKPIRSVDIKALAEALRAEFAPAKKAEPKPAVTRPIYDFKPKAAVTEEEQATKSFDALYAMRFGDENEGLKAVMSDLVGKDYRQTIYNQNIAFGKYLRRGTEDLEREERGLLKTQIFPASAVKAMLEDGMSVASIKATMVEAQGTLGGYAVPPNVQAEIAMRLPGLTAVRGLGARVVTLTNSNAIEIPRYTGGDDRYVGAIRGLWGSETQAPTAVNATLDMVTVTANIYSFKVPMSQSLVEDAANLVSLVQSDIATTMAMDEDDAFLVGDGAGKPLGILPDSGNGLTLDHVHSGDANLLTADGLIGLSEAIGDQYMAGCAFVFRRSAATAIRKMKTGAGEYLFDRSLEGGANIRTLLGYPYRRSEAMPAVAAGTFPIIFGNMAGYTIVERAGLTIARYQDSNTGINKVEFHVRRRVGGRVERPWMFSVQEVAA